MAIKPNIIESFISKEKLQVFKAGSAQVNFPGTVLAKKRKDVGFEKWLPRVRLRHLTF